MSGAGPMHGDRWRLARTRERGIASGEHRETGIRRQKTGMTLQCPQFIRQHTAPRLALSRSELDKHLADRREDVAPGQDHEWVD